MKVTVYGSINMDLVVYSDEIPGIGETVMGQSLLQNPGGKGANQAVALAKLGVTVDFLGAVGTDSYAPELLASMQTAGVNTDRIISLPGNSGTAVIHVDALGQNNIVVIAGANGKLTNEYLRANQSAFTSDSIALFQLEVPLDTVRTGLQLARQAGAITVLNPAPALALPPDLLQLVDILIPNEHELARLSGRPVSNREELLAAAKHMINQGIPELIVTLGADGVLHINRQDHVFYPARQVPVVDTTAAGDSFIGGLLSGLVQKQTLAQAIARGQAAAGLTIQRPGAQNALPGLAELTGEIA